MSERITDEKLAVFATYWLGDAPFGEMIRELQQRRAADKYLLHEHKPTCPKNGLQSFLGADCPYCTCGYDKLPEYLRGGA